MKIDDKIMFIDRKEDEPYLRTPLLDVSMRLYGKGEDHNPYAILVKKACMLIAGAALAHYEDYSDPYGMSGANCGIPWNIIAVVKHRREGELATAQLMLNPKIIAHSEEQTEAYSNCGSIRLKKNIWIKRWNWVRVGWYDLKGEYQEAFFRQEDGGFTIQHEIEHNQGVLITDKK